MFYTRTCGLFLRDVSDDMRVLRTVEVVTMSCAPLHRRLLAYVIDLSLFVIPTSVVSYVALEPTARYAILRFVTLKSASLESLGVSVDSVLSGEVPYRTLVCFTALSAGVLAWLYYRVSTARSGVSVGKNTLGLRVVSQEAFAAGGTQPYGITGKHAFRRLVPCAALGLLPVPGLGFVGYAACLWRKDSRGWHDEAAKSVVVRIFQ